MTTRSQNTLCADPNDGADPAESRPPDARLSRRSFLGRGTLAVAGAAALLPLAGMMTAAKPARADSRHPARHRLTGGDVAILRFLAAAELLETDLWQQYNEITLGNAAFRDKLSQLDSDMATYVTQNTNDEISHARFLNAFLVANHESPVDLSAFATLPSSQATGAAQVGRLTNLMHLNVDTSWYSRYRSEENPDAGDVFPQAINAPGGIVNRPGIPLHDGYSDLQMQAIANTAGFHFAMIEQGGASLYDALGLRVSGNTVLRIVLSIGGTEVAHFQTWHDKAGNAIPLDTGDGLVFPDLTATKAQIMPRPCEFVSDKLPLCSVIRPTSLSQNGAKAVVRFLTDTGLFHGQSREFFEVVSALAEDADEATPGS